MIQKYFLKDKFFKGKNLNIFVVATYSKSSVLNVNRVSYMKICIKKSSILLSVDHPGPGQWWLGQSDFIFDAGWEIIVWPNPWDGRDNNVLFVFNPTAANDKCIVLFWS